MRYYLIYIYLAYYSPVWQYLNVSPTILHSFYPMLTYPNDAEFVPIPNDNLLNSMPHLLFKKNANKKGEQLKFEEKANRQNKKVQKIK